jgi:hypothetical protein
MDPLTRVTAFDVVEATEVAVIDANCDRDIIVYHIFHNCQCSAIREI